MRVPAHVFREYDIRGVADLDLTDEVARGIGRGFATMLGAGTATPRRIAVGRDCRISSDRLMEALVGGLTATGAQVIDVGVGPTPMLYASVHALSTDGGVMITGSHNAADENGFKMMRGTASFFGSDLQALRKVVEEGRFVLQGGAPGTVAPCDMNDRYIGAHRARPRDQGACRHRLRR